MRTSVLQNYIRSKSGPGLTLSAASIVENSVQGTTIGTASPRNANNPGAVSIVSQTLANAIAMTGDGISFAVGSAGGATGTLNYEVTPSFLVTFEYTDDDGTYQFTRTIAITDVDDGPTIAGATTDLETMLGTPQAGVATTGDLRDLFVSPTSQTLTFTVSHGSVDIDGYSWSWTPSAGGSVTVQVTAEDEDGQSLQIDFTLDVEAANNAPTAGNVTLTFDVPPPAAGVAPSNTAVPTLSGTQKVGSSLTSSTGTWTGDAPITYTYQWERSDNGTTGWANISGATNSTYTLVSADDTKYVRCTVTATNGTGNDSASSAASGQILYNVPAATVAPSFTGTEEVGETLTGSDGTWTNSPTSYTRKWQVSDDGSTGWADISGATSSTYDLTASEDGKYVRYSVTATNSGGSTTATSSASGQITTPDVTAPTLSSPVDAASGSTGATGSVDTNEGNGTLYWVVSTSGTAPSAAQVKAGQDHTGSTAADSGSQAVSGTGTQTLSPAPSGLTASTAYTIHFMHEDAAANQSSVASGDGFTTGAAGGISLVGWATASGNNDTNATLDLTGLTGGSDTSPSQGDYVIVFGAASSGVDSDVTISDGAYAALGTDIYQSDSFKVNTNVFAKVQTATPDTSVSINGANNNTGGNAAVAVVLRGVDGTTQLDVAVQQGASLNTALANAPTITPSTSGAWIIAGGGISQDTTPGTFTGPANMTDYHQATSVGSSRGNVAWAALKTDWSSGAFDPDALTGGDESTSYAFGAFTIAVRPA